MGDVRESAAGGQGKDMRRGDGFSPSDGQRPQARREGRGDRVGEGKLEHLLRDWWRDGLHGGGGVEVMGEEVSGREK